MNKTVQCAAAVRVETDQRQVAMLLIQTPATRKLLMWHTEQMELFVRFVPPVRAHPSIIRDWGINE